MVTPSMGIPFSCFHSLQSFLLPFGATVCQHCFFEQEYSLVRVLFLLSVRICKHGGCGRPTRRPDFYPETPDIFIKLEQNVALRCKTHASCNPA